MAERKSVEDALKIPVPCMNNRVASLRGMDARTRVLYWQCFAAESANLYADRIKNQDANTQTIVIQLTNDLQTTTPSNWAALGFLAKLYWFRAGHHLSGNHASKGPPFRNALTSMFSRVAADELKWQDLYSVQGFKELLWKSVHLWPTLGCMAALLGPNVYSNLNAWDYFPVKECSRFNGLPVYDQNGPNVDLNLSIGNELGKRALSTPCGTAAPDVASKIVRLVGQHGLLPFSKHRQEMSVIVGSMLQRTPSSMPKPVTSCVERTATTAWTHSTKTPSPSWHTLSTSCCLTRLSAIRDSSRSTEEWLLTPPGPV